MHTSVCPQITLSFWLHQNETAELFLVDLYYLPKFMKASFEVNKYFIVKLFFQNNQFTDI